MKLSESKEIASLIKDLNLLVISEQYDPDSFGDALLEMRDPRGLLIKITRDRDQHFIDLAISPGTAASQQEIEAFHHPQQAIGGVLSLAEACDLLRTRLEVYRTTLKDNYLALRKLADETAKRRSIDLGLRPNKGMSEFPGIKDPRLASALWKEFDSWAVHFKTKLAKGGTGYLLTEYKSLISDVQKDRYWGTVDDYSNDLTMRKAIEKVLNVGSEHLDPVFVSEVTRLDQVLRGLLKPAQPFINGEEWWYKGLPESVLKMSPSYRVR